MNTCSADRILTTKPAGPEIQWASPGGDQRQAIYFAAVTSTPLPTARVRLAAALLLMCVATGLASQDASRPPVFPLRVDAGRRGLEDKQGRRFVVTGDSAWSLIAELRSGDVASYLDDRAARGFNAVIVSLIEHKFAVNAPADREGIQPFAAGNLRHPNIQYFEKAHAVIAEAGRRGIAVWLCPAYLGWDGGDEGFFNRINAAGPAALHEYGRFVGRQFKDLPNIIWLLGGDYAFPETSRWLGDELAAGLREGGARQLMSAHGGQTPATQTFGDRPWLDIETVYSYAPDMHPLLVAAYRRAPVRPFVLIESTYENEHDATPSLIRRQAWTAMLSGAAGQFFGNNPIWHFDGPTLFPFPGDWRQALDSTGAHDMARLAAWLGATAGRLTPDTGARLRVSGDATPPVVARTDDGTTIAYFVDRPRDRGEGVEVSIEEAAGKSVAWLNPARSTVATPADELPAADGVRRFRVPVDNGTGATDWVLVVSPR